MKKKAFKKRIMKRQKLGRKPPTGKNLEFFEKLLRT